jgi:glucose-1-phosphatase
MNNTISNIKNIVFDLGGVLMNFDFKGAAEKFRRLGLPVSMPDAVNSQYHDAAARSKADEAINTYINGFISEDQFAALLLPHCKQGVTLQDITATLLSLDGEFPPRRAEAIQSLRKSRKVYLLSNINSHMWQRTLDMLEQQGLKPEDLFDGIFLSFQMCMAKPSPDIYQRMIAQTGIVPQETAYFDDLAENIAAGTAAGLRSHLVDSNKLEDCPAYAALLDTI